MFAAGRSARAISCLLLLSLEGALGCHDNEPCMCGTCNDLDQCDSHVQRPDPSSGLSIPLPGPVSYQLQICDVNAIEVAFDGCIQRVPFTSDEDGVFDIAPPTAVTDLMAYGCMSLVGGPVGLYPQITVHFEDKDFEDKEIKVDASCTEELYHGKTFGDNDEIRLVGSCIRDDGEDGLHCHTDAVQSCDAPPAPPTSSPSSPRSIDGGGSCPAGAPCMCGTCSDLCGGEDPGFCGAGCWWGGSGPAEDLSVPSSYELQICDAEEIEVGFLGCNKKVPFASDGDGVFRVAPPTAPMELLASGCLSLVGGAVGLHPFITVHFDDKEIKVSASCSEPLYHGQFFGENDEVQIVGSCIEGGAFCNHLDVETCGASGASSLAACTTCTDKPTKWMASKGKDCATSARLLQKNCNASDRWASEKYCQRSCFKVGLGYGAACCE